MARKHRGEKLLKRSEAARYLNVSLDDLTRLIQEEGLPKPDVVMLKVFSGWYLSSLEAWQQTRGASFKEAA